MAAAGSPTDWGSGERVFGPPSGTLDIDWLVPAVLDGAVLDGAVLDGAVLDGAVLDGATAVAARAALLHVWQEHLAGDDRVEERRPEKSALVGQARAVLAEALRCYEITQT